MNLVEQFGQIDIYLFDQLLKGRLTPDMRILDAGSGAGRNLPFFMQNGYKVYAVDRSPEAVASVQKLGKKLAADWSGEQARVEAVEHMSFASNSFDFVISNAVLHFADNKSHFLQMVHELWRVLAPGGILFVRLASKLGIEATIQPVGDGRYVLPDGSTRFLMDEAMLDELTRTLGGTFVEPLKTVHVAGQRSMCTWCIRKGNE